MVACKMITLYECIENDRLEKLIKELISKINIKYIDHSTTKQRSKYQEFIKYEEIG